MLRDVVVHIINEQPLRCDLLFEPAPSDAVLLCRNLRTLNGKKPLMADHSDSTFMIPLAQVRFVEISQRSIQKHAAEVAAAAEAAGEGPGDDNPGVLEGLARLSGEPAGAGTGAAPAAPAPDDLPDELDDDLLRRIREI